MFTDAAFCSTLVSDAVEPLAQSRDHALARDRKQHVARRDRHAEHQ
jgi:hypothetical protein